MASRILWDIEERMQKSVELLKQELATIRTGRSISLPAFPHLELTSLSSSPGTEAASII